jgi:hypothetical protein
MNNLESKVLRIDWKCLWKLAAEDKNSSTFEIVKQNPNHELNICLNCTGYNNKCFGYRTLSKNENL